MPTKAERLLELFQGRTSEFAYGRVEKDDRDRLKIAYRPSGHPLTLEDLERHMDGSGPVVGVYLLREDSHCKFAAFDIDQQDLLAAEKLRGVAMDLGFPESAMMLVDSGNKGYHLHLFFAEWIPGALARRLMGLILKTAGMHERRGPSDSEGVEIFPKQAELNPPGEGGHLTYGNLIKLPLVIHPASGRLAGIINARRVIPAAAAVVEAVVGPQEAPGAPEALQRSDSAPLAISLISEGPGTAVVTEGGRNATLTSWAGKLRRDGAAGPAIELVLLELNGKLCSPPLTDREVRAIARSVSRYPAGEGDMAVKPPVRTVAETIQSDVPGVEMRGSAKLYHWGEYEPDQEGASIQWLIEQWLIQGQLHLTVGQEKLGKSTQAWHRVEAVTRGVPYLGLSTKQGRVLIMTEMNSETVRTLCDEDDILVDGDFLDLMFLDEYEPRNRIKALTDALEGRDYVYCLLDPLDECLGFDADGVWNPATVSAGIDRLRDLMRGRLAVEGLFHYNKGGKVANSYKFTSKVDHIYELKGEVPSDVIIKFRGRTRAIPKVRRLTGNGSDGYELTLLESMPIGRPSKTQQMALAWMREQDRAISIEELARALELERSAAKQVLYRMVKRGSAVRPGDGLYLPVLIREDSLLEPNLNTKTSNVRGPSNKILRNDSLLAKVGRWPGGIEGNARSNESSSTGVLDEVCPTCRRVDYRPIQQGLVSARQCLECGQIWIPELLVA